MNIHKDYFHQRSKIFIEVLVLSFSVMGFMVSVPIIFFIIKMK